MKRAYLFRYRDSFLKEREAVITAESSVDACKIFKNEYPGRSYYSMRSL